MKRIQFALLFLFATLSVFAQSSSETMKMRIWRGGTFTSYEINEVDSVTFSSESTEDPDAIVTPDIFYNTEEQLQALLNGIYMNFSQFYQQEQLLESYALGLQEGYVITPESNVINTCWTKGYSVVATCNYAIQNLSSSSFSFNPEKYFAQIECIKAITLYMMSQLWGDIPFPDKDMTEYENIYETSRINVIGRAYGALKAYRERLTNQNDYYINNQNVIPFMREMEIELGTSYQYNYTSYDTRFYITIDGPENTINVIDSDSWSMLINEKQESTDYTLFTTELMESFGKRYGVWRAMVRIGKATPKNGMSSCLFFPKPKNELLLNPCLTQNEGY